MNYIVSGTTDVGLIKQTNQDSYCVRVFTTVRGKVVFAVLCDGMGGLSKGEVASASVVNAFLTWTETRLPVHASEGFRLEEIQLEWSNLITEMNRKIVAYGKTIGGMVGTTVTAMLFSDERYLIVNVGDTRAYEILDSAKVLTNDQTVVAKEIAMGILPPEQATCDPRRNVLLQCIGATDEVCPDFYQGKIMQKAVYMLCSDGFRHEITPEEIYAYLQPEKMLSEADMKRNMDTLIELNKRRAERDNITVISIRTF